ncbi:Acetyltransferase (GNAT) family protein [compost metagenome]
MHVELLSESRRDEALAFLRDRRETSLYLLNNLAEYGPVLTEQLNSGNFKVVVDGDRVVAVFVLARRGNLLAQTDRAAELAGLILAACESEPIALQGFVGNWTVADPLHQAYRARRPHFDTTFNARDILFRRPVEAVTTPGDTAVRPLRADDFEAWDPLQRAFLEQEGIPVQGTEAQRRAQFGVQTARGHWWGYFAAGELVSTVALNACVEGVGQVGGVYTPPEHRRRGYSRAVMQRLFADAAGPLGLHTLILFTGEGNVEAQRMYEQLGFERIGHFGLIFGQTP